MELTPHETAIVELLRTIGAEPLHLAFTSVGEGVAFSLLVPGTAPVAGWGASVEEAMSNAYDIPEPQAEPQAPPRFAIVAGTDIPARVRAWAMAQPQRGPQQRQRTPGRFIPSCTRPRPRSADSRAGRGQS